MNSPEAKLSNDGAVVRRPRIDVRHKLAGHDPQTDHIMLSCGLAAAVLGGGFWLADKVVRAVPNSIDRFVTVPEVVEFDPQTNASVNYIISEFHARCSEVGKAADFSDLIDDKKALDEKVDAAVQLRCSDITISPRISRKATPAHLTSVGLGHTRYETRTLVDDNSFGFDHIADGVWRCVAGCEEKR